MDSALLHPRYFLGGTCTRTLGQDIGPWQDSIVHDALLRPGSASKMGFHN